MFQQPESAAAELQHVLPAEHVAALDWSKLKLEPGSYVDEALADQRSELLFAAMAQVSGRRMMPADCGLIARVRREATPRRWFDGRCSGGYALARTSDGESTAISAYVNGIEAVPDLPMSPHLPFFFTAAKPALNPSAMSN